MSASRPTRSYGSGARILSIGIASTGLLTLAYFSISSHVLGEEAASRIALLWSVMFVIISVIYRPIEQLLSRTIAERRARGHSQHPLRVPIAIQAGFALAFLLLALALREPLINDLFDHYAALYDVLLVGTLAYAASYFARGWLAGHEYFALYGGLVLMESVSRLCFAVAVAVGITSGQTALALGIAAAPFVSLVVVPAAFVRRGRERREAPGTGPTVAHEVDEVLAAPITADEADAALAGPGTEGVQEAAAHDALSLRRGTGFAGWVSGIMLSEQTLLNAAVLTVAATSPNKALVGVVFEVLLIARAPLQLFQAIQTSLLPHLTGLETTAGHDAFARAIRITVLAIAVFAAAVTLGLLAIGPEVMRHLFGQQYAYGRVGLAVVGVGMGLHLASGALNQAALARNRARAAATCWLLAAGAFLAWMLSPGGGKSAHARGDRLRRRDRAAGDHAVDALPAGTGAARREHASVRLHRARDRQVGLARVGRPEYRRARDEHTGTGLLARRCGIRRDPPVHLERRANGRERAQSSDLRHRARDELLPTPAGVDRHAEREIDNRDDVRQGSDGRGRVDRDPDAGARVADQVGDVVDMRRGLGVKRHRIGARLDELDRLMLGTLDHQVDVEHRAHIAGLLGERGDHDGADGDRRHEMPVHDVDVDHARTGGENLSYLLAQTAKVGRQDRWRDPHPAQQLAREAAAIGLAHIGCNIDSPQLLHLRIAVEDILTIVECYSRSWGRPRSARSGAGSRHSGSAIEPAPKGTTARMMRSFGQVPVDVPVDTAWASVRRASAGAAKVAETNVRRWRRSIIFMEFPRGMDRKPRWFERRRFMNNSMMPRATSCGKVDLRS